MLDPASYSPVRTNRDQISQQGLRADMPLVGKNSPTMELNISRLLLSENSCCQDRGRGKIGSQAGGESCHCRLLPTWYLGPD